MTARNLRQEFRAAFAEVNLADFDIFIIPEHELHHYNLPDSLLSHTSLSTLTPSPPSSPPSSHIATVSNTTTLQSTPSPNIVAMSAQTIVHMPARGDRSVPQFNPQQPRELRRYFVDLDFAFGCAAITDRAKKKKHT